MFTSPLDPAELFDERAPQLNEAEVGHCVRGAPAWGEEGAPTQRFVGRLLFTWSGSQGWPALRSWSHAGRRQTLLPGVCCPLPRSTEPKVRGLNPLGRAHLLAGSRRFALQTLGITRPPAARHCRPSPPPTVGLPLLVVAYWSHWASRIVRSPSRLITRRSWVRIPPPLWRKALVIQGFFRGRGAGRGAGEHQSGINNERYLYDEVVAVPRLDNRRSGLWSRRSGVRVPSLTPQVFPLDKPDTVLGGGAGHLYWGTIGEQFLSEGVRARCASGESAGSRVASLRESRPAFASARSLVRRSGRRGCLGSHVRTSSWMSHKQPRSVRGV